MAIATVEHSAHVFDFAGTERSVKNLGWLLRHAHEALTVEIRANGLNGNEASLIVTAHGWVFYSPFASLTVLREWLKRPSMRGIPVTENLRHSTTLRDLRVANAPREQILRAI